MLASTLIYKVKLISSIYKYSYLKKKVLGFRPVSFVFMGRHRAGLDTVYLLTGMACLPPWPEDAMPTCPSHKVSLILGPQHEFIKEVNLCINECPFRLNLLILTYDILYCSFTIFF